MAHQSKAISYLLSLFVLCFFSKTVMAQKLREIVITKDTVQELNKHFGIAEDIYIEDGIKMYTVDSLNKVISIGVFRNNKLNGDYFAFYIDVNMLEKKGTYKNDRKHGAWYYWNRNGVLLRTEIWKEDKLISKKVMVKTK